MSFVQGLSNLWGANVYANRSWSPQGVFNSPINVGGIDAWWTNFRRDGKQSNAVEHRGEWLKASPGNKVPTVIKNFTLYPYTFSNGVIQPGVSHTNK